MATWYDHITDEQADLIRSSRLFFVATAAPGLGDRSGGGGPVNLSSKSGVPPSSQGPIESHTSTTWVVGMRLPGRSDLRGPMTLMVCSMEAENAGIVRLYGKAGVVPIVDFPLAPMLLDSEAEELRLPQRQVIDMQVRQTSTSCGYGVPVMEFVRERVVKDRGRRYKADKLAARAGR